MPKHKIVDFNGVFNYSEDLLFALDKASIIAITDTKGIIKYVNQKFCDLSKYSSEELIGATHSLINSGYHSKEFFNCLWNTVGQGNVWEGEIKNKAKDGSFYWVKATIVPLLDCNKKPYRYVAIRNDITDRKNVEEKMLDMLLKDELTGLPNRKKLENEVTKLIDDEVPFFLVHLDFDDFKYINDTLSYSIGDEFLQEVGNMINNRIQKPHLFGRLGSDEFSFIFTNTSREELDNILTSISDLLGPIWEKEQWKFFVSSSMGIVQHPLNGTTHSDLFRNADIAKQKAKKEGKGRWVYYFNEIQKDNTELVRMAQQLQDAIKNDKFTLYYQPKFNLTTGEMIGVEALIRWFHNENRAISPEKFIPLAEETGQIYQIDKWVISTVLNQKKSFEVRGFTKIEISVNLSSKTLMSEINFMELVELLSTFNIDFSKITIEITETAALTDCDLVISRLNRLKDFGLKLALDDFGTGYSSLTYLKILPIDFVKLDRSYVKSIEKNRKDALIIKAILDLANELQYRVIAEGIETMEQLKYLIEHQCESGQGYLLGKPLPIRELLDIYTSQTNNDLVKATINNFSKPLKLKKTLTMT